VGDYEVISPQFVLDISEKLGIGSIQDGFASEQILAGSA
jgi:hypothetical protein